VFPLAHLLIRSFRYRHYPSGNKANITGWHCRQESNTRSSGVGHDGPPPNMVIRAIGDIRAAGRFAATAQVRTFPADLGVRIVR